MHSLQKCLNAKHKWEVKGNDNVSYGFHHCILKLKDTFAEISFYGETNEFHQVLHIISVPVIFLLKTNLVSISSTILMLTEVLKPNSYDKQNK